MSCLKTSISMENVIVVGNRLRNFESNYPTKLHREFWPTGCKKKELTWIKNAIQRIEHGDRFVTDIELAAFADFFGVSSDVLLGKKEADQ